VLFILATFVKKKFAKIGHRGAKGHEVENTLGFQKQ
jgi:glycerophosphoryl diester phosphodiesterase